MHAAATYCCALRVHVLWPRTRQGERSVQKLHPAILELGLAYSDGSIAGSSARSIAMMLAMRCVVRDYVSPPTQAFPRALTAHINACVGFLWDECRPACVPQRNSIKWLKSTIHNVRCQLCLHPCWRAASSAFCLFSRTTLFWFPTRGCCQVCMLCVRYPELPRVPLRFPALAWTNSYWRVRTGVSH
jgi:translation initiation factor 2B subunit (eIF-2B alpha/beta/delta family)